MEGIGGGREWELGFFVVFVKSNLKKEKEKNYTGPENLDPLCCTLHGDIYEHVKNVSLWRKLLTNFRKGRLDCFHHSEGSWSGMILERCSAGWWLIL